MVDNSSRSRYFKFIKPQHRLPLAYALPIVQCLSIQRIAPTMKLSILAATFSTLMSCSMGAMITLDCTTFPESCNNDCYGIFSAGRPALLNWDKPTRSVLAMRRRRSGCTYSKTGNSVCSKTNGVKPWNQHGSGSCDEYPYASTSQGGQASTALRCVDQSDNSNEGRFLQINLYDKATAQGGCGSMPCQFMVMFDVNTLAKSYARPRSVPSSLVLTHFCSALCAGLTRHPNDGFEFKLVTTGNYANAKRGQHDTFLLLILLISCYRY